MSGWWLRADSRARSPHVCVFTVTLSYLAPWLGMSHVTAPRVECRVCHTLAGSAEVRFELHGKPVPGGLPLLPRCACSLRGLCPPRAKALPSSGVESSPRLPDSLPLPPPRGARVSSKARCDATRQGEDPNMAG